MHAATLPPAPPALHAGDGRPVPDGCYAGAIHDLSTAAWDGGALGGRRRWQRKGWMYFGASAPECAVGLAVIDAGYAGMAFVYVHDRERGVTIEEKAALPLAFGRDFAPDWRAEWVLRKGRQSWWIGRESSGWRVRYEGKRLQLEMTCADHGRGLTAVSSAPGRPFHHTYKLCALDARVRARMDGDRQIEADAGAGVDFSFGYPPRSTLWNWASLDGRTEDGRRFGINLVAHFMNGLENGLWLGDRLEALPQALFDYDRRDLDAPWRIRTVDGRIDVRFVPEGRRSEALRLGALASVFAQPFGHFEGTVQTPEGPQRVSGYGVVEEHYARW